MSWYETTFSDVSSVSTHKKGCSTSAAAVEEESSENGIVKFYIKFETVVQHCFNS